MPQIDPVNPGYEFGYEFQYAKRWASQVSYAWLTDEIPALSNNRSDYYRFKGRRIGFEQKFFFPETRSLHVHEYFGLELGHLEAHTVSDPVLKELLQPGDVQPPIGWMSTDRYTFFINFKFGGEFPLFRHFLLDMSAGAGIKYRDVTNTFSNPQMRDALIKWDIFNRYNPVKEWTGTMTFNMKIGYMFGRN
ncbi:hypothetical protein [Chitinophaga barathri]|uniref:Outer membrane protein beta-barrel domain-containing protein n=1 Tax=Chitinophaga barathri TaxID=1647451 RepID=A0A3N4M4G8_9BACT|nr:hypothetical protein [Chitinophaga barathri]RPD37981.1 hypothetical protein EG028_27110 [Chitinophaga barathri]